ncbi:MULTISPECIES: hypothetical protein [unclassified Nocardioides]|uniref:hypothetical protein n=1 Tax=unclassified Nocardioides TaxID=2615069 RepID=UPI0005A2EDF9|nr:MULTISPECIES: hypothetical protein [unclassified Nocardioides]
MIDEIRGRLTLTVPEAGRIIFTVGRDAAYAAAHRGEIPTVTVGRNLRVPTHAALRQVGFSDEHIAEVLGLGRSILSSKGGGQVGIALLQVDGPA